MRRFLLWLGLTVVTVAAVAASFSTLAGLAAFTGWGERLSWLLPASLDALGMTACLVWLDSAAAEKTRTYARWMTWGAAGLSIVGNGVGHLASTGHLTQGLLLVVLVGAVPPAALATTVHLIVLVSSSEPVPDAAPVPAEESVPLPVPTKVVAKPSPKKPPAKRAAPKPSPSPDETVNDVELQGARHADRAYRAANDNKPITRDALKAALAPCGTTKATALLAALKREAA